MLSPDGTLISASAAPHCGETNPVQYLHSPGAHLNVVGMLRFMSLTALLSFWHKPAELAHSCLFCSCVYFCLYGLFNCISFHLILPTTLLFLTLFFRSYFCLIGPFNHFFYIKVSVSADIILCGWLGLKHQQTNLIIIIIMAVKKQIFKAPLRCGPQDCFC